MRMSTYLFVTGIALMAHGAYYLYRWLNTRTWPKVEGTIVESDVTTAWVPDSPACWDVTTRYRYKVEKRWYEGTRVSFERARFRTEEEADEYRMRYLADTTVEVLVNPRNPRDAILEVTTPMHRIGLAVVGLGLLIAGLFHRLGGE